MFARSIKRLARGLDAGDQSIQKIPPRAPLSRFQKRSSQIILVLRPFASRVRCAPLSAPILRRDPSELGSAYFDGGFGSYDRDLKMNVPSRRSNVWTTI